MATRAQHSLSPYRSGRRAALWGLGIFGALLLSSYGVLLLSRARSFQFFGGLISRVDTPHKLVALTIDDGPVPGATERILALLRRHDVRATFFLVGEDIESHPELARALAQAGHQLGNHSYSHRRLLFKTPAFIRKEVEKTNEALRALGYGEPIAFRPPYGKKLLYLPYYLRTRHILTIMWDVEPDSYTESTEAMVRYVGDHIRTGSIVLLHAMNRKASLDALEPLIVQLARQGYRFVTIDELLRAAIRDEVAGCAVR